MRKFPEPIQNAVAGLSRLPGVGPKTALRFVYYLLKIPKAEVLQLSRSLAALTEKIQTCTRCYTYGESELCEICADARRDASILCVVEEPRDISTVESTGVYKGRYFVLGGVLNPIEGMTPDALRIHELAERLQNDAGVAEIILALSPTVQGESTMMYLSKRLAPLGRKVTRLARGLPIGATIEYADEVTLGDALKGRRDA